MQSIKIINNSNNPLPQYSTEMSAGVDLRAHLSENITLKPGERKLIATGLQIELPAGYEAQVRPRSGLALKHGISVLNSPGTIDADYRGDIGVILINHGNENYTIAPGDRIAQMVIAQYTQVNFTETDKLSESDRGEGGFGSSGKS